MNGIFANLVRMIAIPALLIMARAAEGSEAQADTANSYLIRARPAWLPCEAAIGAEAGALVSRLRATSAYRSLVEPTEAEERAYVSPSWGAAASLRWKPGFTLSVSPRRETYGLRTREETVSFQGNPYPHTLEASTELSYYVWPLLAGMGWFPGRQHFQVQLGLYAAVLDQAKVEWVVDGEPYGGHPAASAKSSFNGWMLAAEYGFRAGPGEVDLGIEYERARESALYGLEGSIRPEAAQVRLGYAFILWGRGPKSP